MSAPVAADLEAALRGTRFAASFEWHDEIDSTIDRCRQLAEQGAPDGAVVMAGAQRAGRGQQGRSWFSPAGAGLYVSVLLRPKLEAGQVGILGPLCGLAAAESLRFLGVPCRIKLPNDLVAVHDGTWRKLGGMLVDTAIMGSRVRHAILSLGVNIRVEQEMLPEELRPIAVSCHQLGGGGLTREIVAARFLNGLAAPLDAGLGDEAVLADILARHAVHLRAIVPPQPADEGDA